MLSPRGPQWTRRSWLAAPLLLWPTHRALAQEARGRTTLSKSVSYADPSTEFPVQRLTDPQVTSILPLAGSRPIAKKGNFLLFAGDASGSMQAYRLDLKSGEARQLTDGANLTPRCLSMTPDERGFVYGDGGQLLLTSFGSLRPRELYRAPAGYVIGPGPSVTEDGLYLTFLEESTVKSPAHRLKLLRMPTGAAAASTPPVTLEECDDPLSDPLPRPRRASVLYRKGNELWLANFDGKQKYHLREADGDSLSATWNPNGRGVIYLNAPPQKPGERRKLNNLRELIPDTREDAPIADTTQFAGFGRNGDASVFVGASGSKASPHVLLLVRAVKRELILCEHRASDPAMVQPIFSPNSQRIYFTSDQHGKQAIYTMPVDRLVSETEDDDSKGQEEKNGDTKYK